MVGIFVNAHRKEWDLETINYSELLKLANQSNDATIQFSKGPKDNPQGTLTYKHFVIIQEGMVFDVTITNNA